jgi:glyoxylase-like metal-dependent hydrolase (beta-lactamase superfamily II)
LSGWTFTRLTVTHHHSDHLGLAGWLCRRLNIPLFMSKAAYQAGMNLSRNHDEARATSLASYYADHGVPADIAEEAGRRNAEMRRRISPMPDSFEPLAAGRDLSMAQRSLTLLSGSGHAPEQIMLYSQQDNIFLIADQVLKGIFTHIGVLPAHPDNDPLSDYIRSVETLMVRFDSSTLVLPGHNLPFTGLPERCAEVLDFHHARCDRVLKECRLKSPRSIYELMARLFRRELTPDNLTSAFNVTKAYVNFLLGGGRLEVHRDEGGPFKYSAMPSERQQA